LRITNSGEGRKSRKDSDEGVGRRESVREGFGGGGKSQDGQKYRNLNEGFAQ